MVKEAANLKKHNLFGDSDVASQSSLSSPSPSVSTPGSPATVAASCLKVSFEPLSPLVANCLKRITPVKEVPEVKAKEVGPEVTLEEDVPVTPESSASTLIEGPVETEEQVIYVETAAEPEMQSIDARNEVEAEASEVSMVSESRTSDAEEASEIPGPTNETLTTTFDSQQEGSSEGEMWCESAHLKLETPPGGEEADDDLDMTHGAEPVTFLEPNSVESLSPLSDLESLEEAKAPRSSEDEPSISSNNPETNLSKSPVKSEEATSDELSPPSEMEAVSGDVGTEEAVVNITNTVSESRPVTAQDTSTATSPTDSVKEIRDLVAEVIEVEELVQSYQSEVPKEE